VAFSDEAVETDEFTCGGREEVAGTNFGGVF
jgi:hypothetical protein